jgi:hypothetical protein
MELLGHDDPEVAALDLEEANIRAAELAYRADATLTADFEASGWFPARTAAAKEGWAIPSEGQRQHEPILQLPVPQDQIRFRPSAWAGFTSLLAEVVQRRVELMERRRPEILARIAAAELDLRRRVLDTRVRDLGPLVTEANELLAGSVAARGPVPRTVRTASGLAPARYRERTDELELVDAATAGWSLLDPISGDEPVSVISSTYGIQRDDSPSVAKGRRQHQDHAVRYGTSRSG